MDKFVTILAFMLYGVFVITTCTSTSASTFDFTATPAITTRSFHRRHLVLSRDMECVLYLKDIQFIDGSAEETWTCEFKREQLSLVEMFDVDVDNDNDNDRRDRRHSRYHDVIMDVDGVSSELLESKGAVSGKSIMKMMNNSNNNGNMAMPTEVEEEQQEERTAVPIEVPYVIVEQQQDNNDNDNDEIMKLFIPNNGENMIIEEISINDKRYAKYGRDLADSNPGAVLKTLVVRVSDRNGTRMVANTSQLVNDIFEDDVSLRTQYISCSKDQLRIEPAIDVTESNGTGIVDIVIQITAQGKSRGVIQNEAVGRAEELYGGQDGLSSRFDLVLFCFPKGSGNWIAYAYINRWASFYNNIGDSDQHWCQKSSALMHEVGHNLNLAHSSTENDNYGDQSSLMGYSYNQDDTRMCFNAAKNYQLNWYNLQQQSIDPLDYIGHPQTYIMSGIDDYKKDGTSSNGELITLRLENNDDLNYYIGFNAATGPNTGTLQGRNQVLLFEKYTPGTNNDIDGYGKSKLIAILDEGESYKFSQYKDSIYDVLLDVVMISMDSYGTTDTIAAAAAAATILLSVDEPAPTASPTISCGGDESTIGRFKLLFGIDGYGKETSWTLSEKLSNIVIAEETADKYISNTEFVEPDSNVGSYCLIEGMCYEFNIQDTFGDGICCGFGDGYYKGILDGIEIFKGGEFGSKETQPFCVGGDRLFVIPSVSPSIMTRSENPTGSFYPSNVPSENPTESMDPSFIVVEEDKSASVVPTLVLSNGPSTSPGGALSSGSSVTPSESPSEALSSSPSLLPSFLPSDSPSDAPSDSPSSEPSRGPSSSPSSVPSSSPSDFPTALPSVGPTSNPHASPSRGPSSSPNSSPSGGPSATPSAAPSRNPTESPSSKPSESPSEAPSGSFFPSSAPSMKPTRTLAPSANPSGFPSSPPSSKPSFGSSTEPIAVPSAAPSADPSVDPSSEPSAKPSATPSVSTSASPSDSPSASPSTSPTVSPSTYPSDSPSASPSTSPSFSLSASPSISPSASPSILSSTYPSDSPSLSPSTSFSTSPSTSASARPSASTSTSPLASSKEPSNSLSTSPSNSPSNSQSLNPTFAAVVTTSPTGSPTLTPIVVSPTNNPTNSPTFLICKDNGSFLYKGKKKKTCSWVGKGKIQKIKRKCKRRDQNKIRMYVSCPFTCGKVGLGQCKNTSM